MRNRLIALALFASACGVASASVTINLTIGQLYGTSTGTIFPDNGLVQLIASTTDAVFSNPTAGSFVAGDDIVLKTISMDSSTLGTAGSMTTPLVLNYGDFAGLNSGDALLLRWFPTLTATSNASSVVAGTIFGQFSNQSSSVDGSITWFAPSDGQTVDLNFLNLALGGSYPDASALANLTVTAVPEPSTYATILGFATLGLVGYRRFRRR